MDPLNFHDCIKTLETYSHLNFNCLPFDEEPRLFSNKINAFAKETIALLSSLYESAAASNDSVAQSRAFVQIQQINKSIDHAFEGATEEFGLNSFLKVEGEFEGITIDLLEYKQFLHDNSRAILAKSQKWVEVETPAADDLDFSDWDTSMNAVGTSTHFAQLMIDFDTFSRLPANTDVHVSKTDGRFVPNGGTYSAIPLFQSFVNFYNQYDEQRLAEEIETFTQQTISLLQLLLDNSNTNPNEKQKTLRDLSLAHQAIKRALRGSSEKGGLKGLLFTHPSGAIHDRLKTAIESLETKADEILDNSKAWDHSSIYTPTPPPEESFNHDDWEDAMELGRQFKPESVSLFKYYGQYCTALGYTQANVSAGLWNWWDKISEFESGASLFLGALPIVRGAVGYEWRNDLTEIKKLGVGAVLSVVEVFETTSEGWIGSPVMPNKWKDAGVKQLQLPTPDFETISTETIEKGVAFIHENIQKGISVYVHCKAGRGRSALIEMCYLIKHQGHTADTAFALIKSQRKQAGFSEGNAKMNTLRDYAAFYAK